MTLVAVAWVVVPSLAGFFAAVGGYEPPVYEPKDEARQLWLEAKARAVGLPVPDISWDVVMNVALFLAVVAVWLTVVPPGASRR